jgi:hypothetical protein|tara:strand:+ start:36 stop:1049 length:1014 start_codon:yes stop_codon:yes gene_type:complete
MSTTIGNLVDRIYREYLEPNDDIQSFTVLTGGLTASASDQTVAYNADYLTTEEEDALGTGAFIEINQELMLVTSLNTAASTMAVKRAARGTTLAAHSTDDEIKVNPPFPRKVVFDAVVDQINNLFPTLFAVETVSVTSSDGYTLLGTYDSPGTNNYLISVLKAISQYTDFSSGSDQTGTIFQPVSVELVELPNPFTYTDDTGTQRTITYTSGPNAVKALQFYSIQQGHTVYVTFKKKFVEPTAESDTLSTVGLEDEYESIIMAGVAAQMMSGRDIPAATQSYITESLQAQAFPVGSGTSIRNSLLQYQQILITQARKYLRAKYPEAVEINGVNLGVQ